MKRILTTLLLALSLSQAYASFEKIGQLGVSQGLSSNSVKTMEKDQFGRIWVGTANGVNLISNAKVKQYQSFQVGNDYIIADNIISIGCSKRIILAASNCIIDFNPYNDSTRIVKYNGSTIRTDFILMKDGNAIFYNSDLNALMKYSLDTYSAETIAEFPAENQYRFTKILQRNDDANHLLLAEDGRGIYSLDLKNGSLTHLDQIGNNINAKATFIDSKNILWVAYADRGISGFYIGSGFERIAGYDSDNSGIYSNDISCMAEIDGDLLISTYNNGSCILNRKKGTVDKDRLNGESLSHVTCIMVNPNEDEILFGTAFDGIMNWSRSFFQLCYQSEDNVLFNRLKVPISALQENNGDIWFGNGGFGLFKYDENNKQVTSVETTDGMGICAIATFDRNSLLLCDKYQGLILIDKKSGTISNASFVSDAGYECTASNLNFLKLANTPDGDILLLNCNGHHLIYRHQTGQIEEIKLQKNGVENNRRIENVAILPSHATIACGECIYELDYNTLMARLIYQDNDNPDNIINNVVEDSKGLIWACTPKRLFAFDPRSGKVTRQMEKINCIFMSMAIDYQDQLWLTTDKSLLLMYDINDTEREYPYIFSGRESGITYNYLPLFSLVSQKGMVYFPNTAGMMVVNTNENDRPTSSRYEILSLTKAVVDGITYDCDALKDSKGHIDIPNRYSQFEAHLAIGHFDQTKRIPFKVTLMKKGHSDPIMEKVSGETILNFPRLSFGSYSLLVSQRTIQGWSDPEKIMSFNVARPFIMTIPSYLIFIALILAISITISKVSISLKQIEMDRAMNIQENKHKDDRISLLSNLAHELKTPLSLIYNPVKDMLEEKAVHGIDYDRLERIFNQVQKMSEMVNMILNKGTSDISKSDISIERIDLNDWLGRIVEDFRIDCYGKGLKTHYSPQKDMGMVDMDVKMVEVAVNNIMTNAIKYSDSGTITITTERTDGKILISFQDEGRGFTCKPEELFKRYFREDDNVPGYGLGLSYAKLLINILDGNIKAQKNKGPGSTFTIEFPDDLGKRFSEKTEKSSSIPVSNITPQYSDIEETPVADEFDFDTKSMTLLIADDQDDILQFIKDEYSSLFKTIYTAHDGSEALDLVRQRMPNVVVSDIMMPHMNGFELCKTIKTDLELSSIPVILLTSRSDPKNQDMGYKMGADSFMPKPFDSKLLYKIIRSQLKNRYEIKRQYATSFFTAISEDQTFSAADEQFVLKLNRFIRENLADTMLGVDMIIDHMHVSRTTLFNKMNNLVGASTNKYIRRIRIEVAKEMLAKTGKSVGTIAEETGFSESQYFSTVFKQETGMTPSQYKDSLRK